MRYRWILRLIIFCATISWSVCCTFEHFKTSCGCRNVNIKITKDKPNIPGKKLTCNPVNVRNFLLTVDFPDDVIWVDFSNNHEAELNSSTFGTKERVNAFLRRLYKLDFSGNSIWKISPNTFIPFPKLIWLDLSHNDIGNLTKDMFNGLSNLKVLHLSYNKFPIIPGDAFVSLVHLKKVVLRSTMLVCNCLMRPFVDWLKSGNTHARVTGTCHFPNDEVRLQSLSPSKLKCDSTNLLTKLPHFEITPSKPQLVFEGDRIDIQCEGTNLPDSRLYWSYNNVRLRNSSHSHSFSSSVNHYRSIISGWITIRKITVAHSGLWNCTVDSPHANTTRSIRLTVVKRHAQYCRKETATNDHGVFNWPATVNGLTTNLRCHQHSVVRYDSNLLYATRFCGFEGWADENYVDCPYKDMVTNEIHKTWNGILIVKSKANSLKNLLSRIGGQPIKEQLSLDFIGELLTKTRQQTNLDKENILTPILKLASYIMKTNVSLLQAKSNVCQKFVRYIQNDIVNQMTSSVYDEYSENIAIEGVVFYDKSRLPGMSCTISQNKAMVQVECKEAIVFDSRRPQSSIFLPKSVLDSCKDRSDGYKIYYIAYRNANLFQHTKKSANHNGKANLTIPDAISREMVFHVGIQGCSPENLSDPIVFNFATRNPGSHYPAIWTSEGWKKDGACSAFCSNRNYTRVVCYKFATVTLVHDPGSDICGDKNRSLIDLPHPAILAGTLILSVCLLVVMIGHLLCTETLKVDQEARHMTLNICLHMLVAACLYTFCIKVDRNRSICVICGFALHYSSLTVLFWIALSVRNILRQLIAITRPPMLEPRPPRPMLRFYLIGCGIPLVICGITAAAKVQNYGGEQGDCWLTWETSIYAFYLPAAFVALICIYYLLRVLCTFNRQSGHFDPNRSPVIGRSWQRDNNRVNNCYQTVSAREPCHCSEFVNHSMTGSPMQHHHSSCPMRATEQSFKSQLTGTAVLFVCYIFTWVFAALSIAVPNIQITGSRTVPTMEETYDSFYSTQSDEHSYKQTYNDAFSWLYAILAACIGFFVVMQSLILRKTCRTRCMKLFSTSNSRDAAAESLSSFSKVDQLDDTNLDYLTSSNDKSFPIGLKKHRGYPTIKTDPTSETILESTDHVDNVLVNVTPQYQDSFQNGRYMNDRSDNREPSILRDNGRIANSATSLQKSFVMGQYSHNDSRSHVMDSAIPQQFSHHHHSHDVCRMNSRGYHPDSMPYHHMSYHNHHISHHHDSGKPMKMTNLHLAHEPSMTEHSLDDAAFNNMHTVPVIMQHHTQAKINDSALIDRYQKVRRALDKKRAKQRKLNVLREYAQDPLTSNDEGRNEDQPGCGSRGGFEPNTLMEDLDKTKFPDANGFQSHGTQCYRPLLLSPVNKKQDKHGKSRGSGPNKRVKRLESSGQARLIRSEKRQKQRNSRNSTCSEREQDTASSKNSEEVTEKPNVEKSLTVSDPSKADLQPFIAPCSAHPTQDSRGYLTLQQLQSANTFLFPNRGAPLKETPSLLGSMTPSALDQEHIKDYDSSQVVSQRNETCL